MTTYLYTGNDQGGYIEGLPATDLDTVELNADELVLLNIALLAGLYEADGITKTIRPTGIES